MKNLTLLGYANGNLGKQILYGTVDLCFLYYLTDILGVSPILAGYILFISLAIDALFDPIVGIWVEKLSNTSGNYSSYILVGTPIYLTSFIALFFIGQFTSYTTMLYIFVLLIFRLGYTIIDIPHNAMISRLIKDPNQRTKAAAWRFFFSSIASLITAQALKLILTGDQIEEANNFKYFSLLAASLALLSLSVVYATTYKLPVSFYSTSPKVKLRSLLYSIYENRKLVLLLIVIIFTALLVPIFSKGIIYFAKYQLQDEKITGKLLTAITIGQMISLPCWIKVANTFSKTKALQLAHLLLTFMSISVLLTNSNLLVLTLLCTGVGFSFGAIYMLIWSILADLVDQHEVQSNIRFEASLFAISIMLMKIALGLSTVLLGTVMDAVGFKANSAPTEDTLISLKVVFFGLPAFGGIICWFVLKRINTR